MEKKPTHLRCGKTIKVLSTGEFLQHKSINKAKKTSRELQKNGAYLRLVDKFPQHDGVI